MANAESKAEALGITRLELMEKAGREVAKIIDEKKEVKGKKVLVVCYHGNNGGDGFVVARHLAEKAEVDVLFLGEEAKFKPEALANFNKIYEDPAIQFISLEFVDFESYDIIIDAIFGTGIKGNMQPQIISAIEHINNSGAYKVSVDVPSGVNPDTGEINDIMVNADLIIALHDIKVGAVSYKDKTVVADLGIK
jgi:ADP-dependent NAD(P)H-hydrate dehydratase / NAD(P)H-hydrate epimerase